MLRAWNKSSWLFNYIMQSNLLTEEVNISHIRQMPVHKPHRVKSGPSNECETPLPETLSMRAAEYSAIEYFSEQDRFAYLLHGSWHEPDQPVYNTIIPELFSWYPSTWSHHSSSWRWAKDMANVNFVGKLTVFKAWRSCPETYQKSLTKQHTSRCFGHSLVPDTCNILSILTDFFITAVNMWLQL